MESVSRFISTHTYEDVPELWVQQNIKMGEKNMRGGGIRVRVNVSTRLSFHVDLCADTNELYITPTGGFVLNPVSDPPPRVAQRPFWGALKSHGSLHHLTILEFCSVWSEEHLGEVPPLPTPPHPHTHTTYFPISSLSHFHICNPHSFVILLLFVSLKREKLISGVKRDYQM